MAPALFFFLMHHEAFSQPIGGLGSGLSCLFVNPVGKLFRVHCPFRVVCRQASPPYQVGDIAAVIRVGSSTKHGVLYKIDHQYFVHHYFALHV